MKKDLLNWSIWKLFMQIKQETLKYFHIDKNRNILKWNFKILCNILRTFTYLKSTIKTLEKRAKYVQS